MGQDMQDEDAMLARAIAASLQGTPVQPQQPAAAAAAPAQRLQQSRADGISHPVEQPRGQTPAGESCVDALQAYAHGCAGPWDCEHVGTRSLPLMAYVCFL